jgi:hypothetical protein
MGVQKTIEMKTGIELNYWRINAIKTDLESDSTEVRVGGYIAKADALAQKRAIKSYHYRWVGFDNPVEPGMPLATQKQAIEEKIIAEPGPFQPRNPLEGGTIVSDLPD